MDLLNKVKDIAKKKGLSLKAVAEKMNTKYVPLYQSLNSPNIRLATLYKVAEALDIDIVELIEPTNPNLKHFYDKSTGEFYGIHKI